MFNKKRFKLLSEFWQLFQTLSFQNKKIIRNCHQKKNNSSKKFRFSAKKQT